MLNYDDILFKKILILEYYGLRYFNVFFFLLIVGMVD